MGAGTFVDNEICTNKTWNVEIKRHATTVLRGNRIHGGGLGGISIHGEPDDPEGGMLGGSTPTVESNDIYSNVGVGVHIGVEATPTVRDNTIRGGHRAGVLVSGDGAKGSVVGNTIDGNDDGVVLREGACPTVEGNTIVNQRRRASSCARGQARREQRDC